MDRNSEQGTESRSRRFVQVDSSKSVPADPTTCCAPASARRVRSLRMTRPWVIVNDVGTGTGRILSTWLPHQLRAKVAPLERSW